MLTTTRMLTDDKNLLKRIISTLKTYNITGDLKVTLDLFIYVDSKCIGHVDSDQNIVIINKDHPNQP